MTTTSVQLLLGMSARPGLTCLPVLGDALEEEGNHQAAALVRDPQRFIVSFVNWYGKHLFARDDGLRRQLCLDETLRLRGGLSAALTDVLGDEDSALRTPLLQYLGLLATGAAHAGGAGRR